MKVLTKEYIQSIVKRKDLVVRNLQVTQGYYRISRAMKRYVSGTNVTMQAWEKCSSGSCDWGQIAAAPFTPPGGAMFHGRDVP